MIISCDINDILKMVKTFLANLMLPKTLPKSYLVGRSSLGFNSFSRRRVEKVNS